MNFQYTRKRGEKHTYKVTVRMTKTAAGDFEYQPSIYRDNDFKGTGIPRRLTAVDLDSAMMEAREYIEIDIEDLAGVDE